MDQQDPYYKNMKIPFPWVPDMIYYTAYKFGVCELCEKKKLENEKWDNSGCPHCKSLTKIIMGTFS